MSQRHPKGNLDFWFKIKIHPEYDAFILRRQAGFGISAIFSENKFLETGHFRQMGQEGSCYAAVNARPITTHLSKIEKLIKIYRLYAGGSFILDEIDSTSELGMTGAPAAKMLMLRSRSQNVKMPEFKTLILL